MLINAQNTMSSISLDCVDDLDIVFAALMLTSGRLGDLYGRRRFFVAGLLLFGASSLLAGGAPSALVLIGARAVQGIGAAMILPATLSTINAMFTGRDRGIAFAIYGAAIGGMAAVGPLVGGWLATDFSWRWAFWLNVPFVLATLPVAARLLPETRDVTLRRGIDVPGTVLASLGLAGIVFGLIESSTYGWLRQDDGSMKVLIRTPDTSNQQSYYFAQRPCWQLVRMTDESI